MAHPKSSTFRIREVSFELQNLQIQQRFPGNFLYKRERNGKIATWQGRLQPTELSPAYLVEVRYKIWETPQVRVLWPDLVPGALHLYPDGRLCLFWPKEWRWRRDQLIAETILPWTSLWLRFYELWLDTGTWLGPSSSHTGPKTETQDTNDHKEALSIIL